MAPKQKATLCHVLFFIMRLSAQGFRISLPKIVSGHCMLPCPSLPACQHSTFTACLQSRISVLQEVIVPLLLTFFFLLWPAYCAFGLPRLWNKYISFTCLHVHTTHLNYFMPFKKIFLLPSLLYKYKVSCI